MHGCSTINQVSFSVYWLYVKSMGVVLSCCMLLFFILFKVANVYSSVWLSRWTSDPLLTNASLTNTSQFANRQNLFLGIYAALGGIQGTPAIQTCLKYTQWTARDARDILRGVMVSVVRRMNEITLCRTRLVLGWVTVFGPSRYVTSQLGQLSLASLHGR